MKSLVTFFALSLAVLSPKLASAHCDTMDGPVVKTARKALETGKVGPVLAWVQAKDEAEIKSAFEQTLAVRKLAPAAQELADRYFFETLVRVHRAGEGAPYVGLKPAGSQHEPGLAEADRSIETGKLEPVRKLLGDSVKTGLAEKWKRLRSLKVPGDDVRQGREWVEAYVKYVHYVAGVQQAAAGKSTEHGEEGEGHDKHHEE